MKISRGGEKGGGYWEKRWGRSIDDDDGDDSDEHGEEDLKEG